MVYIVLMAVISLGVAAFAMQNATAVKVSFLMWDFDTSLAIVMLTALVAGLIIAFCWGLKLKAEHYLKMKKIKEQIEGLEKEKARLSEQVDMLMHTRMQNVAAEETKEEPKA